MRTLKNLVAVVLCVAMLWSMGASLIVPTAEQVQNGTGAATGNVGESNLNENLISGDMLSSSTEDENMDAGLGNKDSVIGVNGELLMPFDMAYTEAFESGSYNYDTTALLIKMDEDFGGELTEGMKLCGFTKLEKIFDISGYSWYKAYIPEDADIRETSRGLRLYRRKRICRDCRTGEYAGDVIRVKR